MLPLLFSVCPSSALRFLFMLTLKRPLCGLLFLSLALPLLPACKDEQPVPPKSTPTAASEKPAANEATAKPVAPPPPPPARAPVGMVSPFPHLSNEAAAALNRGWAALKTKKYEDAATAFLEVTGQLPDYQNARYQAARALVLAGKMPEARAQFEELLRRNYPAYVDRASKQKDLAPFRASPEWPAYQQAEKSIRSDYADGLMRGLVLVARSGAVDAPTFAAGKTAGQQEAKLDWKQEAYHVDVGSGRFRALTASDGRLLAALRSPDGKRLVYVTAERIGRPEKDAADPSKAKTYFVEPQLAFVDLATLDVAGPIKLGGGYEELTIGFGKSGTPLLSTLGVVVGTGEGSAAGTYEMDTARTGLTPAVSDPQIIGERVVIRPDRQQASEQPLPANVTLAEDRHSLRLGASGAVITSARTLSATALAWSPAQALFAYAGQLDGCAALRDEKAKAAQNEIFVYEVEKKTAQRIDSGASAFALKWLSDTLLAYETGSGAKSNLNLYDVAAAKKTTLPLKYGAGFVGIPTWTCGTAPSGNAAAPTAPQAGPAQASPVPTVPSTQAPAVPTPAAPAPAPSGP